MVADEAGIVTVGKDSDGHGYVLADLSGRYFPGHRHLNPPSALADKFGVLWRSMPANNAREPAIARGRHGIAAFGAGYLVQIAAKRSWLATP
jgi:hypothetical protein